MARHQRSDIRFIHPPSLLSFVGDTDPLLLLLTLLLLPQPPAHEITSNFLTAPRHGTPRPSAPVPGSLSGHREFSNVFYVSQIFSQSVLLLNATTRHATIMLLQDFPRGAASPTVMIRIKPRPPVLWDFPNASGMSMSSHL